MRKISSGVLMMGICFCLGCATPRSYTWQDVTRVVEPTIPTHTPQGHLVVYTPQLDMSTSEDSYYPYSGYMLYNSEGKRVKAVENHTSREDRYPETVELPPGKYVVIPNELSARNEIVGAVIEDGKTTEVHYRGV